MPDDLRETQYPAGHTPSTIEPEDRQAARLAAEEEWADECEADQD